MSCLDLGSHMREGSRVREGKEGFLDLAGPPPTMSHLTGSVQLTWAPAGRQSMGRGGNAWGT